MNTSDTISADEQPSSSGSSPKPTPSPITVGGMTLKKRDPAAGRSSSAGATPRPAGAIPKPAGARPVLTPKPAGSRRMERFSRVLPSRDPGVRMNEQIRATEIRVIGDDGQMVGVMTPKDAMELARSKQQDLIEIVPNAKPPVCKIIEFGKWKYEQQKREKQAKKSSHQQLLKEVRFHPRTDTHDFEFKVRHARNFIEEGHKVKAYVQFKGREVNYKQFGEELLSKFRARMEDIAKVDQDVTMMGRMMSMVLSPAGKKKSAAEKSIARNGEAKDDQPAKPRMTKKPKEIDAAAADAPEGPETVESPDTI